MTDRELLEAAAKAAGLTLTWGEKYKLGDDEIDCTDIPYAQGTSPDEAPYHWDPITDDADALRLAVKCGIDIERFGTQEVRAWYWATDDEMCCLSEAILANPDHYAATRRAIVRAAASLTKETP